MGEEKRRPGVLLYFDKMRPIISLLSAEERGDLVLKIFDYAEYDKEPIFVPGDRLESLWPSVRKALDRDATAYREKCERLSKAAQARWERERAAKQQQSERPPSEGRT